MLRAHEHKDLVSTNSPSSSVSPKKILFVSENLGTPARRRGIFYYSSNLIRALSECGHETCLLVENTKSHGIAKRVNSRLVAISRSAARGARTGDVYYHLSTDIRVDKRGFWWSLRKLLTFDINSVKLILGLRLKVKPYLIENDLSLIDFVPSDLDHLKAISSFVISPLVYRLAQRCSRRGLDAITLDARGYDIILVDMPMNIKFTTSPDAQVITVIHDLIPLFDVTLSARIRRIFANNLVTAVKNSDSFIFVSQSVRSKAMDLFPTVGKKNMVLHPAVDDAIARGVPPEMPAAGSPSPSSTV
jgi:hypothetical protein